MGRRKSASKANEPIFDMKLLCEQLIEINTDIFNHEKPPLSKQQFTSISTSLRKKHSFYKKVFPNFTDFAKILEDIVEVGRRRNMRGIDPADSSKDDSEEERSNSITLHTTNGGINNNISSKTRTNIEDDSENEEELVKNEINRLQKKGVKLEAVANKNMINNLLKQQYMSKSEDKEPVLTDENSPPLNPKVKKSRIAPQEETGDTSPRGVKRTREEKRIIEEPSQALASATAPKPTKKKKITVQIERPTLRYSDVGGINHVLQEIRELVEYPFTHPEIYKHLGVEPARGILLFGPPGSGKTMLANAIAGELGVPFLKISAPEIVSGMSGESEAKIRQIFKDAVELAPSLIFIDEIDAITPKRDNAAREMEKRIVAQLLTCIDDLNFAKTNDKMVLVIGATNRPDSLDDALRRAGRFDREISLGIPDEEARKQILQIATKNLKVSGDFDYTRLAKMTPGFVGADLKAVVKEAAVMCINRIFHQLLTGSEIILESNTSKKIDSNTIYGSGLGTRTASSSISLEQRTMISEALRTSQPLTEEQLSGLSITMHDFEESIKKVQPSSKREGFATVPDVTWEDIGALESVREELQLSILEPIRNSEKYAQLDLTAPSGVLLYGPPGCGKTLLAKAIANDSGANFISVKGPELLNKFVGESERAVRQVFARAQASSPCVIFFDELDALAPKRNMDSTNSSTERVVNQLLTEMDGVETRKNVFVIAATNRPDIIDPAMLRPGRLDKKLFVPLPNENERISVLNTCARKKPLHANVDLRLIAAKTEFFSGADLAQLVKEASISCLKENLAHGGQLIIEQRHFEDALTRVAPSVTQHDRRIYEKLNIKLKPIIMEKSINGDDISMGESFDK